MNPFGALSPHQMASLQQAMQMAQSMGALGGGGGGGQARGGAVPAMGAGGGMASLAGLAGMMGGAGGAGGAPRGGMGGLASTGGAAAGMQALQQVMGGGTGVRPRAASVSPRPLPERPHHTGWIEKQGGIVKSWKKRYFVLSDNMMRYFASPDERAAKGTILLANIQSVTDVSNSLAKIGLVLQTPNRAYLLRFDAEDVREQWRVAIQAQLNRMRGFAGPATATSPASSAPLPSASMGTASAGTPLSSVAGMGGASVAGAAVGSVSAIAAASAAAAGAAAGAGGSTAPTGPSDDKLLVSCSDYQFPVSRRLNACFTRMVQHVQGEENGGVLLLTGEAGVGTSGILGEFVNTVSGYKAKELENNPFFDVCHGWHDVAALVCSCGYTKMSNPATKAIFTVKEEAGNAAGVEGGLDRIRNGEPCPACGGATKLQWFVMSREELEQAVDMFNVKRVPLDVILLRCKSCNATAFPMAEDGLCVAQEGHIVTQSGQLMPGGDRPEWRSLFAHVCRACSIQQPPLEHVAVRLNVADMDSIKERSAKVAPHRAKSSVPLFVTVSTRGNALTADASLRGILVALNLSVSRQAPDMHTGLPVAIDGLSTLLSNSLRQSTSLTQYSMAAIVVDLDNNADCDFGWIPVPLPPSIRIIIASTSNSRSEQALQALSKQAGFAFHKLVVPKMSVDDSTGILSNMWAPITGLPYPEGDRVRNFVNASNTGNGLYLRLLCSFARFHQIAFDDLPAKAPRDLDALVNTMLTAIEVDTTGASKAAASVVALNRHFLTANEIAVAVRHMLPAVSEADAKKVLTGPLSMLLYPLTERFVQTALVHTSLAEAIVKRFLPGAEKDRAHAQLAGLAQATAGPDLKDVTAAEDLAFHLTRSGQADKARSTLLLPLMAETRVKAGRGQMMLVDLEYAIARLPGNNTELERHLDFVSKNYNRLSHSATIEEISRASNTAVSAELLHGVVVPTAHLHSRIVRIFTSSTFDDLKVERDALMRDAYPKIRQWCESRRLEFQVVDMRWGIRDESTNDHQTTAICMQEIVDCQRVSIGPNFVTFLSQRYGYRPFPDKIVETDFQQLLAGVSDAAAKALLTKWFLVDTNVQPPTRVLQPVTTFLPDFLNDAVPDARAKARSEWWTCFETMSLALRKAAETVFKSDAAKLLPYVFSVTENEIRTGLLALDRNIAAQQCLWFKRNIRDLDKHIESGDKRVGAFTDLMWGTNTVEPDAKRMLHDLRMKELPAALPAANVHEYSVDFKAGVGIDPTDATHAKYISTLVEDFQSALISSITANLATLPNFGLAQEEILQHLIYARDEAKRFGGRRTVLDTVRAYLRSPELCSPLVITGESGCGKSALTAALVNIAREEIAAKRVAGGMGGAAAAVVIRFVGLTAESSEITTLLRNLLTQLTQLLSIDMPSYKTPEELQKAFMTILCKFGADSPLVLLLDGLDQIAQTNFGRELNRWLPPNFPCGIKIVLTMLNDKKARVFPVIRKHIYGQPGFEHLFVTLGRLDHAEAMDIVSLWLAADKRTLTASQLQELSHAFKECSSPLFMRLAYNESRRWASYTPDSAIRLPRTIRDVILALFARLVRVHGRKLVENACMYIALARDGLSFTELENLLSLDEDVLNDVFQYWEPPQRRLPPLLWVRLRRDLGEFLFESNNGAQMVYRWAHAQFSRAVEEEFLKRAPEPVLSDAEPTAATMKADEAVRLAALLLEAPTDPVYSIAESPIEREMHKRCAEYWMGKWHGRVKPYTTSKGVAGEADRAVPLNPILLSSAIVNEHYASINPRRCRELPRHMALAGMTAELAAELAEPGVVDFYVAPDREDTGEVRALFGVLGGMPAAAKIYLDALTARVKGLASADQASKLAALMLADCVTLLFGYLEHRSGPYMPELYAVVMEAREGVLGKDHPSSAAVLMQQAYQLINVGNVQQAVALVSRALDLRLRGSGEHSELFALALNNAAEIMKRCQQYPKAIEQLRRSIEILRKFNGPKMQDTLAAALNNLGHLMLELGQATQSILVLQEAMQTMERVVGPDHQDLANVLNNLASALQARGQMGDLQQAMQMQARAIQIRQFRLGSRHPLVAQSMSNMAALYFSQGHVNEALPLMQRAVEIARLMENMSERDDDLGTYMNNLASAYQMMGRLPEAAPLFEEALGMLRKSVSTNPRNLAQAMQNLAGVLLDMRHLDRAQALFLESLPLFERHYGPMDAKTGLTVEGIACCLQLKGRNQEALPWVQRTYQIQAASGAR